MLYRFSLDLAIPQAVYDSIPTAKKIDIRDRIRELKSYAVKINEGLPYEEDTTRATWHECYHDEGLPCKPEQNI